MSSPISRGLAAETPAISTARAMGANDQASAPAGSSGECAVWARQVTAADPQRGRVATESRLMVCDDGDSITLNGDLLRGQHENVTGQFGSLTVKAGRHKEVAATLARFSGQTRRGDFSVSSKLEFLTGRVALGADNPDGSRGRNVDAHGALLAAEVGVDYQGNSLTLGWSFLGFGGEQSEGQRDSDGDGLIEDCKRGSIGPITFGICRERSE